MNNYKRAELIIPRISEEQFLSLSDEHDTETKKTQNSMKNAQINNFFFSII